MDDPPIRIIVTFSGDNGLLDSAGPLTGFTIRNTDGEDLHRIFSQRVHPEDPDKVVLEVQVAWAGGEATQGAQLHYGWGNDPFCKFPLPV